MILPEKGREVLVREIEKICVAFGLMDAFPSEVSVLKFYTLDGGSIYKKSLDLRPGGMQGMGLPKLNQKCSNPQIPLQNLG